MSSAEIEVTIDEDGNRVPNLQPLLSSGVIEGSILEHYTDPTHTLNDAVFCNVANSFDFLSMSLQTVCLEMHCFERVLTIVSKLC